LAVRTDRYDAICTVQASGEIDALTCGDLQEALNGLMDRGNTRIVLDMSGAVHISSAGLSVLLAAAKRLHGTGRFAVAAANRDVRGILEMAGLANIIDICETVGKALAAVSEPGP